MAFFKLLGGQHIMADPSGKPDPVTGKRPSVTYYVGDVIESQEDLARRHGSNKFQRVSADHRTALETPADMVDQVDADPKPLPVNNPQAFQAALERMPVRELIAYAAEHQIDLNGATRKDLVIAAIKAGVRAA